MAYASDSGHWYNREGVPCYTLKGANGKIRNTTLRDARKNLYVPSVTEVMKIMAKPALERWKLEQVKLAALTLPQIKGENLDQFSKRIDYDANQQSDDARNLGTEIHGEIERYFQGKSTSKHTKIVFSVAEALKEEFGEQEWYAENSFSHPYGFGGKIDLYSNEWVIDYKTKDFTSKDLKKKFSYHEHLLQLSAYRIGLNLPYAGIANVFISRTEAGLVKIEKHDKDEGETFLALLEYWKALKGFDCSYL